MFRSRERWSDGPGTTRGATQAKITLDTGATSGADSQNVFTSGEIKKRN